MFEKDEVLWVIGHRHSMGEPWDKYLDQPVVVLRTDTDNTTLVRFLHGDPYHDDESMSYGRELWWVNDELSRVKPNV